MPGVTNTRPPPTAAQFRTAATTDSLAVGPELYVDNRVALGPSLQGPPGLADASATAPVLQAESREATAIRSHAHLTPDPCEHHSTQGLSHWRSSDPCREAEPMDMTMPGCFRRRWRTARSYSADAPLTGGGHTC